MIQIGAYSEFWPDIHMTPEEGVRAHLDLQGGTAAGALLPIHWGTFNLAPHPWAEPGEGTLAAARATGAPVAAAPARASPSSRPPGVARRPVVAGCRARTRGRLARRRGAR